MRQYRPALSSLNASNVISVFLSSYKESLSVLQILIIFNHSCHSLHLSSSSYHWTIQSLCWLTEHGFTSAPTQYRLYGQGLCTGQCDWPVYNVIRLHRKSSCNLIVCGTSKFLHHNSSIKSTKLQSFPHYKILFSLAFSTVIWEVTINQAECVPRANICHIWRWFYTCHLDNCITIQEEQLFRDQLVDILTGLTCLSS